MKATAGLTRRRRPAALGAPPTICPVLMTKATCSPRVPRVKIFISWSGEHAKQIATAVHAWLKNTFDSANPWMSDIDISGGEVSLAKIAEALDGAKFGIVVTTQDNQNAPWLSYEAGAMSRVIDGGETRVMPMLVDLRIADLTSPIKQFQGARFNEEGVGKLIKSLGEVIGLDGEQIKNKIDMCWPKLEEALEAIPKPAAPTAKPQRLEADVLDELVSNVRALRSDFEAFQFFSAASSSPTGRSSPDFSWRQRVAAEDSLGAVRRQILARVLQAAETVSIIEDLQPHLLRANPNRITVTVGPTASDEVIRIFTAELQQLIGDGRTIRVMRRRLPDELAPSPAEQSP